MTTRLEEELVAGMRERTTSLRLSGDIVARAARRRRRRARLAAGSGVLGTAAALAVMLAALGGDPAAAPGAADGDGSPPEMLTVTQVSQRAAAALAGDDVKYAVVTTSYDGRTARTELWQDPVTGNSRRTGVDYPGGPEGDTWVIFGPSGVTVTHVDRTTRTWWRFERPDRSALPVDWTRGTPEELRRALLDGDHAYELVGPEKIDGQAVVHLRSTRKGGAEDLWVDASSYRPVRWVVGKPGDGKTIRRQEDIRWMPRGPESLAPLTVAVPAGFTRVDVSAVATPSPR